MILLLLFCMFSSTIAQFDNEIVGDPEVNCADNFLEVHFDTRQLFSGLIFVKDHLSDPKCRSATSISGLRNATILMKFKECGIDRRISTTPRGLFISTTLVVAFHPDFLTKYDRVYKVQCFYMEMDRRLEKEVQVNMPPPTMQTKQVPMPVCKYEVLEGSPTGPSVYYATIGQMVYHKWTCESEVKDTFCMTVHSCFVDDGNGDRVQLINEQGCALDKYLLTNLEYPENLVAGREAHVYKYADRDNMYFDCQITVRMKEPAAQYCDIPTCPDPPRRRRSHLEIALENNQTEDVLIEEDITNFIIPSEAVVSSSWWQRNMDFQQISVCLSSTGILGLSLLHSILLMASGLLLINTCQLRSRKTVQ